MYPRWQWEFDPMVWCLGIGVNIELGEFVVLFGPFTAGYYGL